MLKRKHGTQNAVTTLPKFITNNNYPTSIILQKIHCHYLLTNLTYKHSTTFNRSHNINKAKTTSSKPQLNIKLCG